MGFFFTKLYVSIIYTHALTMKENIRLWTFANPEPTPLFRGFLPRSGTYSWAYFSFLKLYGIPTHYDNKVLN